MDVKYLNYILTIAEKKNITKAAEELFLSQSSLSQYLAKLEQEIGAPLFVRARGELSLTPAGALYVEAAKKVVQIQKELYENIRGLNFKSHITVGVTSQFGLRALTQIIPPYKKHYPEVTIEITESNVPSLTRLLLAEDIDCAIMALNSFSAFDDSQIVPLGREEVLFAVPLSHHFCETHRERSLPQSELIKSFAGDNFLLSKKGSTLRTLADGLFAASGFSPSTMCETNSVIATRAMVASGIGVAFLAASCASDRGRIAYYSLEPPLYRENALVCRRGWIKNRPEEDLIRAVSDYFKDLAPDAGLHA